MKFRAYKIGEASEKAIEGDDSGQWPGGPLNVCFMCEEVFKNGQVVFAAKSAQRGTVSFHKSCIKILAQLVTVESEFDKLQRQIHEGTDPMREIA